MQQSQRLNFQWRCVCDLANIELIASPASHHSSTKYLFTQQSGNNNVSVTLTEISAALVVCWTGGRGISGTHG